MANRHFRIEKAFVILFRRILNRIVLWVEGLNEHFPWLIGATGTARDLRQQLKRSLTSAKVWQTQCRVGIDHANQGDIWKV